ncbi:MAG: hypothetical protein Sapg2KO_27990 [Saprospiraceae bacterium]
MSQLSQLPVPLVKVHCGTIVQTTFEDEYFELDCLVNSFTGYFDPARWTSIDKSGAGRVDVTGAPIPALLVEGISNNLIEVANGQDRQFNLVVPADGYLSFQWEVIGSSITSTSTAIDPFSFSVNGNVVQLPQSRQEFLAPYLHQGDQLSFEFSTQSEQKILIKDFSFASNASGVIERNWMVEDDQLHQVQHTQLITITRTNISDIRFPTDLDFKIHHSQQVEQLILPEITGMPYVDQDGDEDTEADRLYLNNGNQCDLDIKWEDQLDYTESGDLILHRVWQLHDLCNGSQITEKQLIFFQLQKAEPILPRKTPKESTKPIYYENKP